MEKDRTIDIYLDYLKIAAKDPDTGITPEDVEKIEIKKRLGNKKLKILGLCFD